jgi:hypothetical protein
VIEFSRDIPAAGTRRAFLRGERYVVVSAEAARELYPEARIVSYEDGTPYDDDHDRHAHSRPDARRGRTGGGTTKSRVSE